MLIASQLSTAINKAAMKKFIDRTSPLLPPAYLIMLSYSCLAILFMNGINVFRVIIFSRHKRLWLVDSQE